MSNPSMTITGDIKNLIFDMLKSYVNPDNQSRTLINPAFVSYKVSPPNRKTKYAVANIRLGFVVDVFEGLLESTDAIDLENIGYVIYASVKNEYLNNEGKQLSQGAKDFLTELEQAYPDLMKEFNDFLTKWEVEIKKIASKEGNG